MAHKDKQLISLMVAVAVIFALACSSTVHTLYLSPKGYSFIGVFGGVYSVSFSSPSCVLTLGYLSSPHYYDMDKLYNSIPDSFTVVSKSTYYSNNYAYYSFSDSTYFVLFNNGTSSCNVDTFSTNLEITKLSTNSAYSVTLPYDVTKTFSFYSSDSNTLSVKSTTSDKLSLKYDSASSLPTETPYALSSSKTINGFESTTIQFYYYSTTYVYLKCNTVGGCPVSLSYYYKSPDSSTIIPAIIVPVVITIIVPIIVIIVIISVILRRRRMAAAKTIVTTTTTEETTRFIQPPTVSTTVAQQSYVPPYVPPQLYNCNANYQSYQPENQTTYVQPQTTTYQPPTFYTPEVNPNVTVQSTSTQSKM